MGKTEKIVVLSVLFAIVVLFVYSLDQGEPKAAGPAAGQGGTGPGTVTVRTPPATTPAPKAEPRPVLPARNDALVGDVPVIQPRPHTPAEAHPASGPMLAAGVTETPATPAPSAGPGVVLRAEWDLVTLVGLEATVDPEVFATASRAGDTWESLAERLYGDAAKARVLRRANEGTGLAAGTSLLVPAIDRLPSTPEVREVEVLEGEGLWHVAKRALGSGARWRELHEANLDRIANPDQVKAGTLLRVP